ncbi:hypothetical protein COP2_044725 [Malus domestica]
MLELMLLSLSACAFMILSMLLQPGSRTTRRHVYEEALYPDAPADVNCVNANRNRHLDLIALALKSFYSSRRRAMEMPLRGDKSVMESDRLLSKRETNRRFRVSISPQQRKTKPPKLQNLAATTWWVSSTFITFLLSIPIEWAGAWLSKQGSNKQETAIIPASSG